ncbi:hypothetical protein G5716_11240 [Bacillus pacificus]|nr:hypothetical protein [Bacillus pacificus]
MEVGETLNVREAIVSNRPRENSGSKSANRFDYQKTGHFVNYLKFI